nr:putative reverse transcriptase, RNA-dependent DNA polymerase, Gag-polypeptide of LTR copia-type [Tanacetum cinerariifolium]
MFFTWFEFVMISSSLIDCENMVYKSSLPAKGNHLHLHPNDCNCASIVSVKLTGVENYRIWASAMKLDVQIKHKIGFVNETRVRSSYLASTSLLEQCDIFNVVVLNWILSSLSQDVYLGNVFSDNAQTRAFDILNKLPDCDCAARSELGDHGKLMKLMQFLVGLDDIYQPIRSSLLTREVLPEVKDAFMILAKEESHRGIPATTAKSDKPQAYVFVFKVNDVKRSNSNANWNNGNTSNNNRGNYNSILCKKCGLKGHTIKICFKIIGYPPGFKRNHNQKVNGTFNNNKSNNANLKGNSVGTNNLKTSAGTMSFTNEQDLKKETIMGTGSESVGLYLFDVDCDKVAVSNQSKLPSLILNDKSPFSSVYGREPNHSHLRSFGCLCFVDIVKGSDKFSERSKKCVLIGIHQQVSESVTEKPGHDGGSSATPLDEIDISEGNVGLNEVLKTKSCLCLRQRKYCLELLREFGLLACRPVMTPLPENLVLSHKEFDSDKPDISYYVCLSQHMHAPLRSHFDIALRVLKYLKLAPRLGVDFSKRKGDCLKSKRQATLSKSSAEVEYRCMASTTCEVMWIVKIMKDFGLHNLIPG